jgi:hypothetical protein
MSPTKDTVTRISGTGVGDGVGEGVGATVTTGLCEEASTVDCSVGSDVEGSESDVTLHPVESNVIHPKNKVVNIKANAMLNGKPFSRRNNCLICVGFSFKE